MKRRHYSWGLDILRLRRKPGAWELAYSNVPVRIAKRVRLRAHPALRTTEGYLEAKIVNPYTTSEGQERGDLWLRFIPGPPPVVVERTQHENDPQAE